MYETCPASKPKRALLIEPQSLFAPYFVATIEAQGLAVVGVVPRAEIRMLRALVPDIVIIDADHLPTPPLRLLRGLRRHLPHAHIVVYVHGADPVWPALARSLGADVVMGPRADESDLIAALAPALRA